MVPGPCHDGNAQYGGVPIKLGQISHQSSESTQLSGESALSALLSNDPCSWRMVTYSDGSVSALGLPGKSLSGTLSSGISNLTNLQSLPQELDEAARRRLTKRLYIPPPSSEARAWIIRNLLQKDGLFKLSEEDTNTICKLIEGYSGSDMKNLVKDASMGPLREALRQGVAITKFNKEDMRLVTLQDFESALQEARPSISLNELGIYEDWNKQFGSLSL